MPWKRAWPTEVKNKLKGFGLSDQDIQALEATGGQGALKAATNFIKLQEAKQKQVLAALEEAGLM
jgi:hypothetical protein